MTTPSLGLIPQTLSWMRSAVLAKWADPDLIYLITDQSRLPHWQKIINDRFHIFHQVTASGSFVVLSNEL